MVFAFFLRVALPRYYTHTHIYRRMYSARNYYLVFSIIKVGAGLHKYNSPCPHSSNTAPCYSSPQFFNTAPYIAMLDFNMG